MCQIGPSLAEQRRKECLQTGPLLIADFFAPQQQKIRYRITPLPLATSTSLQPPVSCLGFYRFHEFLELVLQLIVEGFVERQETPFELLLADRLPYYDRLDPATQRRPKRKLAQAPEYIDESVLQRVVRMIVVISNSVGG